MAATITLVGIKVSELLFFIYLLFVIIIVIFFLCIICSFCTCFVICSFSFAGGGFCVYSDITLSLRHLRQNYPHIKKVMIIDLDAHQVLGGEKRGEKNVRYIGI